MYLFFFPHPSHLKNGGSNTYFSCNYLSPDEIKIKKRLLVRDHKMPQIFVCLTIMLGLITLLTKLARGVRPNVSNKRKTELMARCALMSSISATSASDASSEQLTTEEEQELVKLLVAADGPGAAPQKKNGCGACANCAGCRAKHNFLQDVGVLEKKNAEVTKDGYVGEGGVSEIGESVAKQHATSLKFETKELVKISEKVIKACLTVMYIVVI